MSQTPEERRDARRRHGMFYGLPGFYATLYPALVKAARERGYALAIHGTLARDMDLIAVPWTQEAVRAEELIEALMEASGGWMHDEALRREHDQSARPHGRRAWSIHLGFEGAYVDVSVMPRVEGTQ